jgi:2,3-bisphosphoglycerate-independent phosphoglycerate mutase
MVLLCILDGFGINENTEHNAIAAADHPTIDNLLSNHPHTSIATSGKAVGLPKGQMGNSEVGHLNIGAGRVVYQEITRIDNAIEDGSFLDVGVLNLAMERVRSENKAVHLFGLVSDGQVHSSMNHLFALIDMAKNKGVEKLFLHAFMDGRDTSPTSGKRFLQQTIDKMNDVGLGRVATVSGRYYAMDRDKRWERTEKAWQAIVNRDGKRVDDPIEGIQASYDEDITDEFIIPMVVNLDDDAGAALHDRDLCIYFNFRADRARQLSYLLLGYDIEGVDHPHTPHVELITLTNYDLDMFEAKVAFYPVRMRNILGEVLAKHGKKQLRTAETEKYAHVTFFFNGGVEKQFEGEDRDLIPSPKVPTYDHQPEMSAPEVTENAVNKINSGKYDLVVLNYANCDMVGHTGDFDAARKAVEAVDQALDKLLEAVKKQGGVAIITADHGNAEQMWDPETDGPFTAHTINPVPCILYDPTHTLGRSAKLRQGGALCDLAPTVLDILDIEQPKEMTGKSLIIKG